MNRVWMAALAALLLALPACGGGSYGAWDSAGGSSGPGVRAVAAPSPMADEGDSGGRYEYNRGRESGGEAITLQRELAEMQDGATSGEAEQRPRYAQADPTDPEDREARTATDAREGPLLIYTANLALAVHQVSEQQGRIEALARDAGGYLHHRGDTEIRIRVPAESFQRVLAAILELGDVLSRDVTVQDVSEEFHDVQTRIRTLEAMYARVEQLLANAEDVEHALAVEQHLERITLQLESLRGRLRFLADRVAFSTITVRFTEQSVVQEPQFELPFRWLRSLGLPNLMRLR